MQCLCPTSRSTTTTSTISSRSCPMTPSLATSELPFLALHPASWNFTFLPHLESRFVVKYLAKLVH